MSFQIMRPWFDASEANREAPLPKVSYCPIKAAVKALSPVIILTSCDDSFNSWMTESVSSLRGHSAMIKPAKVRFYSASSLV